jgi:hypothetical protein
MDKVNEFDKYIVIWKDEHGGRVYEPFRQHEDAYQHMIEKLSEGKWACLSSNDKLPKIHYSHNRTHNRRR